MLKLYDTLSRQKVEFRPLDPANVRMYVCGPTVYDFAHIGNARPVIVFDVLYRLLRHVHGADHVTYVRNLTDVDDKINKRAFERWTRTRSLNAEIRDLTETTAAQFHKDVAALGCLPPTREPRATEYVCDAAQPLDMVRLIERLIERGHAYPAEGHVLFHVPSMKDYGKLARRSMDELLAGARVDVAPYKKDPTDFVLWKPSDRDTEPGWDSPWGYGRPGWHIECSAMAGALLGQVFDIHGGGIDLVFPHHENEIAQTCCAFGTERMAQVWMHNGFLMVEGEKMSKSLGNFITINELLTTDKFGGRAWPGEVLRLAMLKTHYRQPIDWTVRALEEAEKTLLAWAEPDLPQDGAVDADVLAALANDLNTSEVIARLHALGKDVDAERTRQATLRFLGFTTSRAELAGYSDKVLGIARAVDDAFVASRIESRLAARRAKDFKESDRIRDELLAMGIRLKDGKDPATGEPVTTWEVVR
jgi:cysteinyl-tRNA synthetase